MYQFPIENPGKQYIDVGTDTSERKQAVNIKKSYLPLKNATHEENIMFLNQHLTKEMYHQIMALPFMNMARLFEMRRVVEYCVRSHRVFMMPVGYTHLRAALIARGWKEKYLVQTPGDEPNEYRAPCPASSVRTLCQVADLKNNFSQNMKRYKRIIISQLLQQYDPDFYWSANVIKNLPAATIFNRIAKSWFTHKSGLCSILRDMYWHCDPDIADVRFPRCYYISDADEAHDFVTDFRLSACISLLKYFVHTIKQKGGTYVRNINGSITANIIDFALERCREYIRFANHEDIDITEPSITDRQWMDFLRDRHMFVDDGEILLETIVPTTHLQVSAEGVLEKMSNVWPQFKMDGMYNVWIVKPENQTKGIGIQMHNTLTELSPFLSKDHYGQYVIQKYIESPFLVHETKFDIRQWFLVTSCEPLVIWMYKKSYLRFCSEKYTMASFHESIHITNHAIQKKYPNGVRDAAIPRDNMWNCDTLKIYLSRNGYPDKWSQVIYPGMKKAIIGVLLASQEMFIHRENSFQLYGADFTIDEDFTPWLVEINENPDLNGISSKVTAQLCPECLRDLIKVVIDRKKHARAPTGAFEMIYEQKIHPVRSNIKPIFVEGEKITIPEKRVPFITTKPNKPSKIKAVKPFRPLTLYDSDDIEVLRANWNIQIQGYPFTKAT